MLEKCLKELDEKASKEDLSRLNGSIKQDLNLFPSRDDLESAVQKSRQSLESIYSKNLNMMKE